MTGFVALSVRQSWAWAIAVAGKDVENRIGATWMSIPPARPPDFLERLRELAARSEEEATQAATAAHERRAALCGMTPEALTARCKAIVAGPPPSRDNLDKLAAACFPGLYYAWDEQDEAGQPGA